MLAARNKNFRIAAQIGALSFLILTASEIVEAVRLLGLAGLPGAYAASAVIYPFALLLGACGWIVIATAFGAALDCGGAPRSPPPP